MSTLTFDSTQPVQAWQNLGFPEPSGVIIGFVAQALQWVEAQSLTDWAGKKGFGFEWDVENSREEWFMPFTPAVLTDMINSGLAGICVSRASGGSSKDSIEQCAYERLFMLMVPLVGYALRQRVGTLDQAKAEKTVKRTRQQVADKKTVTLISFWNKADILPV